MVDLILQDALQQAILFTPLILGIFLSYKILGLTDLTADGSYVLGAGVFVKTLTEGLPLPLAIFLGMGGGAVVGIFLSTIQRHHRVPPLVASILCVFMLTSLNLILMERPNISILTLETSLNHIGESTPLLLEGGFLGIAVLLMGGLFMLLRTPLGLQLRAFGDNPKLMEHQGYASEGIRMLGLCLSNLLYALSGIMVAQSQGYADVNMGFGVALVGIGSILIGHQLFQSLKLLDAAYFAPCLQIIACVSGIFLYMLLTQILLSLDLNPIYLKLLLGMLLVFVFGLKKEKGGHHGR